jgi:hypothetical protein
MNRLAFIGWQVLSLVLLFASLVGLGIGVRALDIGLSLATELVFGAIVLVLVIAAVWTTYALQAKRIRDAGLPPLMVIVAVMLISIVDEVVLTHLTEMRFPVPFHHNTPIGGVIAVAYLAMLMLWPSADARRKPPASGVSPVWPCSDPTPLRSSAGLGRSEFGVRAR